MTRPTRYAYDLGDLFELAAGGWSEALGVWTYWEAGCLWIADDATRRQVGCFVVATGMHRVEGQHPANSLNIGDVVLRVAEERRGTC